ncbi:MAG: T9SS type A sorting domain-containing protein [Chitinophagales bacterium]|nr:T9SS type A sorting domain-containing protein [Chitinophagales bacterium]
MKITLVYFVLLFLGFTVAAQTTVQWSDSIVVDSTTRPITSPRIALLPDGTPLVTWGINGDFVNFTSQIWCSRFENGAFTTPIGVVQEPDEPLLYGFGGYDVALSDSQVFIVFEQQGIFLAGSKDGGLTFGSPTSVQGSVAGGYAILAAVTVDGTGNPVVSYILHKNNDTDYLVRRSTDGGFSFNDDPVIANAPAPGGAVCECCTSDLLASGDSVWLLFRNNNQDLRDIWVSRSTDLAATFDAATDVDATDWQLNFCPVAGPRMARSGDSLITVWMSGASGTPRVYLSTLHAGTMKKGQQLDFPTASGDQISQSQADVTSLGDTIGVVFVENGNEILFDFSTKGASGLNNQSERFAVPDHTLQLPSIAFRDGIFHLVYVDATAGHVLYRRGILSKNSSTNAPESNKTADILLFPNPTKGEVILEILQGEVTTARLTDVHGNTLWHTNNGLFAGNIVLDLSLYPAGVYFIQINVGGIWKTGRIVKWR